MHTAPSARRITEISFLRILKWKKIALRNFRFWLFLQLLLKNLFWFDLSTSLSLSRSKIRFFGEMGLSFICLYYSITPCLILFYFNSSQWIFSFQCSKSSEMENFAQRFFSSWWWIGTHFENEKAFCTPTICRIGWRVLWTIKYYFIRCIQKF